MSARETELARKARDAEVKAQRRKNHCSSDDVWSVWSAAKSGEVDRSVSVAGKCSVIGLHVCRGNRFTCLFQGQSLPAEQLREREATQQRHVVKTSESGSPSRCDGGCNNTHEGLVRRSLNPGIETANNLLSIAGETVVYPLQNARGPLPSCKNDQMYLSTHTTERGDEQHGTNTTLRKFHASPLPSDCRVCCRCLAPMWTRRTLIRAGRPCTLPRGKESSKLSRF